VEASTLRLGPFGVLGDEQQQGPNFNYARAFTWARFSEIVLAALKKTMENVEQEQSVRVPHVDQGNPGPADTSAQTDTPAQADTSAQELRDQGQWVRNQGDQNLEGDREETAKYCGLEQETLPAFASWTDMWAEVDTPVFWRMFWSAFVAIIVQWGTTGAAIVIAYQTPVMGLGCRSGAYVLY
jgi:hypothetical protein